MGVLTVLWVLQQVGVPATSAGVTPAGAAVAVPRFEESVVVDGALTEDVWSRAARLDGFSQYEPADGRPAAERTEVLVWYAPDAIHFGIVAYDSDPQAVRATRADRDNLDGDDHVVIYLDTFRDRRRAFFFAVNALGVQQDGVRTEGAASAGRAFGSSIDRSPDFLFDSSGRLTADGYVVEVRIPFRSLRYAAADVMEWGINIERTTQRTGFVDTWPAVRRASASFLAQGGSLTELRDLRRGMVFEAQPTVTVSMAGAREEDGSGRFLRERADPSVGVNLRLGFTKISLDGTINPDFSQVEADAGQVTVNERFALFLPEKRPFFLEGIELFATPGQLVYTRRIADPIVGGKVTGKLGATSLAYMSAIDQRAEDDGRDALFHVARLRRDVGASSLLGATFTDRTVLDAAAAGTQFNRVAAADARIVFAALYYFEGQLGGSWTRRADATAAAPVWKVELDRTGRAFGFNYSLNAVGAEFESHAGFVNRNNVVNARGFNRLTHYGVTGATLERITFTLGPTRVWTYGGFGREAALEGSEFVSTSFRLRGDWDLSTRVARDFVELDPRDYALFETVTPAGPEPYSPLDDVSGASFQLSARTPVFQQFDADVSVEAGRVAIFAEGSAGDASAVSGALALRPSASVRLALSARYQHIRRAVDGSEFARTVLPRLSAEFQPTRAFFLRAIAEYRAERRSALRAARTGAPLQVASGGVPGSADGFVENGLRIDLLASYRPTPGTVAFLGYGAALIEPASFRFDRLRRTTDGLFLKLAYQIRR